MSMELVVFISREQLPDPMAWQEAISRLGFDIELDTDVDVEKHSGFWPVRLAGQDAGFEYSLDSIDVILEDFPNLRGEIGRRDCAVQFMWGGEILECASVMGTATALVEIFDGLAFLPQDDELQSADDLRRDYDECLAEAIG